MCIKNKGVRKGGWGWVLSGWRMRVRGKKEAASRGEAVESVLLVGSVHTV